MTPPESCPPFAELEELATDRLADVPSARIRAHVTACTTCARQLEELRADLEVGSRLRRALGGVHDSKLPEIEGYVVKREVGRGGMGVVYEAEQVSPRRRVALKVVRGVRYVDAQTLRLFQREIRVLARLEHPGIASLYGAGETQGEHWFAMEFVEGRPITLHVHDLPVTERLDRFLQLCDAIAHAHGQGVVHRDLKPSNVLVTDAGRVQVLDFGLAKITDNDVSVATEAGHIRGTLAYMSPEQARGDPAAIGLATDVYSLGVVLYELLCDALPIDTGGVPIHEAARRVCDEAPRRPSAVVPALRGDLETIVLKALEKDPHRRYASVAALAQDVRRFMANDVILARPPSAAYEFQKLVARHKLPFAFASVIVLGSLGVAIWTSVLYGRETDLLVLQQKLSNERAEALVAESEARARAESAAELAREKSQLAEKRLALAMVESGAKKEGLNFLVGMFTELRSREARTGKLSGVDLLKRGIARLRSQQDQSPFVRITLLQSVGSAAVSAGLSDDASRLLEEGITLAREHAPGQTILGAMLVELGLLRRAQARSPEALALLREGADVYTAAEGPESENAISARVNLTLGLRDVGEARQVITIAEELLALTPLTPEKRGRRLNLRTILAQAHQDLREFDAAKLQLETGLDEYGEGGSSVFLASALNSLGLVYLSQSQLDAARSRLQEALDMRVELFGPDHELVASSCNNLAAVAHEFGDHALAEQWLVRASGIYVKRFGADSLPAATSDANRAENFIQSGDLAAAAPLAEHALRVRRAVHGESHPQVTSTRVLVAKLALLAGRPSEAEPELLAALPMLEEKLGPLHPDTVEARFLIARAHAAAQRAAEAREVGERALADARRTAGMSQVDLAEIERFVRDLGESARETSPSPVPREIDASPR